ncbi:hypothetical protein DAEQUDRAFT_217603 [Daedalea quercina L-15889]|uniref:Uncharacterized protein n=1 Tax=Daedalea quercina L-15889 TaxID=1314783 RepID=A0A165R5A3_9APHY|nr:hypothetical protein DAEQUDRAFT_217603 [Daedalea quercina L-15889]
MLAPGPSYITNRSADVILSDVRPIKLAYEALQVVNVLLDELLYTILNDAQSLATDKLKTSLLKIIPTSLGKEALLEAEVELKSYTERNTSSTSGGNGGGHFSLQWSFELLRLRCEAYSTMNDTDEDGVAERRLNERMRGSNVQPPHTSEVAPAALYLTAILEAVCEHILGNISSVAARDSSRTVATSQDVFTALCEDDAFYGTFKTLKVYEQIEQLSRAHRPRRSKSFTRGSDRVATPTSRTSSATQAELAALRDGALTPARPRVSMESLRSNATAARTTSPEGRASMERKSIRRKFMTHSRSSSEKETDSHSQSEGARSRASGEFEEDDELAHEFDELMRSGSTMKVSLTPDRLRTMEVFNKERTQRAKQTRETGAQFSDKPAGNEENSHALPQERPRAAASASRPMRPRVDSIVEDEEETSQASKSFTSGSAPLSAASRFRSVSISNSPPHPRHELRKSRDQLLNGVPVNLGAPTLNMQKSMRQNPKSSPAGMPMRTRKIVRNRESLDLDEVMNGSDEGEEDVVVSPTSPPRTPSRASAAPTPITPGKPKTPHISAAARELISFLDEGPPEELEPSKASMANASVISFGSSKPTRTSKLSRMMSKLTIGNGNGSSETLNTRYGDETPKTPRSLGRKPSGNFGPPTAFKPSLTSKRSFPNVVVSPPRVPPYHGDGAQTPTSLYSISSGTRMVSPSPTPTASTAPLIPRPISTASWMSDESQAQSLLRGGNVRKGSAPFDEFGSQAAMSRDGSLHHQGAYGSHRLRAVNGDVLEEHGVLEVKTNGHVPIISPVPRSNNDRIVSPSTPRRSPIPRKPPPSPVQEKENPPSSSESSQPTRKPSATPAPPAIVASDVADLRRYLQRAETVDECRLLVDMFFASHGFPAKPLTDDAAPSLPELPRFMSLNALQCSYAELFLSPDSIDFPSLVDETSSEGSSASSRDFPSPASDSGVSPALALATVQE